MSVAIVSNKNILKRKIFFPELDTTVLLVAIPKKQKLTDVFLSTKRLVLSSIENPHQFLNKYNVLLITESSIFDRKILSILYEALKYKNIFLIDDLLVHPHSTSVSKYYLVDIQTAQRLYSQNFLGLSCNLICKEILNYKLILKLLTSACSALWIFYRNCITHMFFMLKSNDSAYADEVNRNFCICNVDDNDCNVEIQKFKIFSVIQTRYVQNYYDFHNHLFQSLTHRKKDWLYETTTDSRPIVVNNNSLYDTSINSNLNFWKALWNYYQIIFNTTPFISCFSKLTNLTFKKSEKETADWIKCTVSKIRSKLKGTLYDNVMKNDTNSVNEKDVADSNSILNDDSSQFNSMGVHRDLKKYWVKRYRLFSKFDDGIKLDYESWFSVTPERIAIHIAEKCKSDIVIDAFCGAGGNSIQFANTCQQVISIDIDLQKLLMARHNAEIYGVAGKIDFILGNFFCLAGDLIGDVVFLSPPWGGPKYVKKNIFDLKNIMEPYGGEKLLKTARKISRNIAYYLPKNINTSQLLLAGDSETRVEVEKNFLNDQVVAVTAYYGNLVDKAV